MPALRPGPSTAGQSWRSACTERLGPAPATGISRRYRLNSSRTAQGEAALADESIHLGAAFQLAGYRHVIGTLWNLRDTAAPEVARGIYAKLANPQAGQDDAATALHDAVLHLKQLPGFRGPIAWAPYIHFGP